MSSPTNTQQLAIAARGNVLVSAGAGTGKTSTLVQRCISLLAEGCSLENILMVTFTEAAAVEMRGRIREALTEKCRVAGDECHADSGTDQSPADAAHFEQQLALLDTALISTLHGFCLQLVREHFYELGIDPDVSVLDEQQTQPLIQQTLDSLLEKHYAGDTSESQAVRSLIRAQGSDENIRKLVLKLHRYSQARDNPEAWLAKQQAMFEEAEPRQWREWLAESFVTWRASWLPVLQPFSGTQAVALTIGALEKASAAPAFDTVAEALQQVRVADNDENWPRGSKTKVRKPLEGFFKETAFLASLTPRNEAHPLDEDWDYVRKDMLALLGLTREFTAEFSRAKRDLGGVDFADIEQFALRVLRNPQTAAQWQQRLHHIFVDEYQDINAAQDAILTALSRSGANANRFLVGDVKQSIYRFRLADPTIFRTYEKHWSNGLENSQRIALGDNFRSREGVLDFVNALFDALMREGVGGVSYERLHFGNAAARVELAKSDEPRVELHLICKGTDANCETASDENGSAEENGGTNVGDLLATEREARLVALRLRELKEQAHPVWDKNEKRFRPVKWSDMAVLLRSPSSRIEGFAKEFAACGVPLEAARGGFFASIEVSDLISLLKLLDNPLQDIPFLAVLRSPLVGMSVIELAEIRASEPLDDRARFFWSAAQKFHQQKSESSAWKKLDVFLSQLIRWRELVRQSSLSACLETALDETQYEALLRAGSRGEQQLGNVRRLLDLAREYDPYQRQGLFRFLRFVEMQSEMELSAAPSESDAVQLTSIHRSKGLEFPVVALAGMGWNFNFQDLRENILLDERFGLCPKITPPDGEGRYPSLSYWLAARHQRAELLGEELRLLYVAMTRARDTLLLVGTSKKAEPWEAEASELDDRTLLSARCYLDWLRLWLPGITCDGDWNGDREGKNQLLRWHIYSEDDQRLALEEELPSEKPASTVVPPFKIDDSALERVNWNYSFVAATEQRAKTSVTELRRNRDEEADRARFLRRSEFALSVPKKKTSLTAAEIGSAHHLFLQRVDLAKIGNIEQLRSEAERLKQSHWLSDAEFAALDFRGLDRFWRSAIGKKISANAASIKRELPFTARLSAADLEELGVETLAKPQTPSSAESTEQREEVANGAPSPPRSGGEGRGEVALVNQEPLTLALSPLGRGEGKAEQTSNIEHPTSNIQLASTLASDEFVVVQGVADLVAILPNELWLLDFKTDGIWGNLVAEKTKIYTPQLKLYARALSRIYKKPVTNCWLYFLSPQTSVSIPV